jgi:hypothetical protein
LPSRSSGKERSDDGYEQSGGVELAFLVLVPAGRIQLGYQSIKS